MKQANSNIAGKIALIDDLPSPSPVVERLLSFVPGEEGTSGGLDEIISMDPGVSAQVLRVANSAYFGFSGRISTISKAVLLLGPKEIWTIAMGIAFHQQFSSLFTSHCFDLDVFWQHSFLTGVVEDRLAREIGHDEFLLEDAMTMGLLHDIGRLVMATHFIEEYDRLYEYMIEHKVSVLEAESATGMLHTDIGKKLCRCWKLPASIEQAVAEHHYFEFSNTSSPSKNGVITGVSNLIANELQKGGAVDMESGALVRALEGQDWLRLAVIKIIEDLDRLMGHAREIMGLIKGD